MIVLGGGRAGGDAVRHQGTAMTARRRLERPREQVLAEAMAAIAEHGLAQLTMAALARRLGTSGGHIMYYFRSKDELLLETLRWSEEQLAGVRAEALDSAAPVADRLTRFADLYIADRAGDPRWMLWIEVWSRAAADERIRDAQAELDRAWRTDLIALLEDGVAHGGLQVADPSRSAVRLTAMLDGLSVPVVLGVPGASHADAVGHFAEHVAALRTTD